MKKFGMWFSIITMISLVLGLSFQVRYTHELQKELDVVNEQLSIEETNSEKLTDELYLMNDNFTMAQHVIKTYYTYCKTEYANGNIQNSLGPWYDDEYIKSFMDLDSIY